MLTQQSQDSLNTRIERGNKSIRESWGHAPHHPEDHRAAVKDAISDILTAYIGPAGKTKRASDGDGFVLDLDGDAVHEATLLANEGLDSYFGDAEDYIEAEEPEPKKLPADVDIVVLRDPDFSNEISVFGGEANVIDIDVGYADLNDRDEWGEWVESRKADFDSVVTREAQGAIIEIVASYADSFGHVTPTWAVVDQ